MQRVAWLTREGLPLGNGYFGGMPSSLFSGFFGTKLQKASGLFPGPHFSKCKQCEKWSIMRQLDIAANCERVSQDLRGLNLARCSCQHGSGKPPLRTGECSQSLRYYFVCTNGSGPASRIAASSSRNAVNDSSERAETPSVVAVCVNNPDGSPVAI
jgi:hypothetical protein